MLCCACPESRLEYQVYQTKLCQCSGADRAEREGMEAFMCGLSPTASMTILPKFRDYG